MKGRGDQTASRLDLGLRHSLSKGEGIISGNFKYL
jgi:hypothetical protein